MRLPSVFSPGPRLRIFAALTVASAAVISFVSIKHLAEYAGFGEFSWLFPLTLDAVAAFGMDLWVTHSPAWKRARALALTAIIGSLIANITDHWLSTGTVLPAVLGAVPPGMLAALLAVLHQHASGSTANRAGPDPAVRDAIWSSLSQGPRHRSVGTGPQTYMVPVRLWSLNPAAILQGPAVGPMLRDRLAVQRKPRPVRSEVAALPVRSATLAPRSVGPEDDVLVKSIRDTWHSSGCWPSKRVVMEAHSVGSGRALRLLALAKETEVPTDG
jgi:hypothetical protein